MARKHILAMNSGAFAVPSIYHVNQPIKLVVDHRHWPIGWNFWVQETSHLTLKHSGVASRTYVIGLPRREDRQKALKSLERAMGKPCELPLWRLNVYLCLTDITFTYHYSTDYQSPVTSQISERIRCTRVESRKCHEAEPNHTHFLFPIKRISEDRRYFWVRIMDFASRLSLGSLTSTCCFGAIHTTIGPRYYGWRWSWT